MRKELIKYGTNNKIINLYKILSRIVLTNKNEFKKNNKDLKNKNTIERMEKFV